MLIAIDEVLLTERCRLRYPRHSDIEGVWSATRTPGFNDGLAWEAPTSLSELEQPLKDAWQAWQDGNAYSWVIEDRNSCAFLGRIAIRRTQAEGEWSIGFWIHPDQQQRGLATEAAREVVSFGFDRLGAKVISAAHATWNVASGRVLARIGMTRMRINPQGLRKRGAWVAEYEYEVRAR
ncbi:MAG: GNAT family N-acetyltransferase [Pseudomonadota bacterium]